MSVLLLTGGSPAEVSRAAFERGCSRMGKRKPRFHHAVPTIRLARVYRMERAGYPAHTWAGFVNLLARRSALGRASIDEQLRRFVIQELLASEGGYGVFLPGEDQSPFAGIVDRIGSLILDIKRKGIQPGAFSEAMRRSGTSKHRALAALYRDYEESLAKRGLMDLVDQQRLVAETLESGDARCLGAETRHIAILLRARTRLTIYEDALRSNGIPFHVLGGVGFYQRQEVLDLWCLLKVLVETGDEVSLAAVLRSPLFALSDEGLYRLSRLESGRSLWKRLRRFARDEACEQQRVRLSPPDLRAIQQASDRLSSWRNRADRFRTSELLSRALEETGAWGAYAAGPSGPQTRANVRKFIEVVRTLEDGAPMLLADVVDEIENRIETETREGQAAVDLEETGVRVMTIHAAKGLEFPVVCLVDADRNFNIGGTERILKDQQLGLGFTVSVRKAKGPGYQDVPTTGRRKMLERSRSRSIAEEKRLLYVACTRARDHLLISGVDRAAAPDRGSFRDWLVNEGEKVPGLTVTESDNLMQLTSAAGTVELPLYRDPDAVYGAGAEVARTLDVLKQAIRLIEQAPQQKVPLPPALKRALERRPVRPGIDRHSTYQLITYKECPRKFEYRYLYAIPEWTLFDRGSDDMSEALRKTSRHALNFGRLCHRVFEALPHVGAEAVDDLITRLCREEQVDEIEYHKELRDVVDRARNSVLWSKIFGEQGESEVPFSLDLDKRVVEGVIDRTREGDTLEVFDYKTTKVLDKKGKVDARIVDQVVTNHRVQMQVYAAGVAKAHGVLPEKVEAMLFFTDLPNDPKRIDVSQADRAIAETVNQIAESLANDHFPPAPLKEKESRESHCRKCGYWQHRICSERRAGKSIK